MRAIFIALGINIFLSASFPTETNAGSEKFKNIGENARVMQQETRKKEIIKKTKISEEEFLAKKEAKEKKIPSIYKKKPQIKKIGHDPIPPEKIVLIPEEEKKESPEEKNSRLTPSGNITKYISPWDSERYLAAKIIDAHCKIKEGCDPYLMMGVIIRESNAHLWRINDKGAGGIAQFLEETARGYGLQVPEYEGEKCSQKNTPNENGQYTPQTIKDVGCDIARDERFHPEKAIPAMIAKIQSHIYQNKGNIRMALANYNGGWWPNYHKEAFELSTEECVEQIKKKSEKTPEGGFKVVSVGTKTSYGGMENFSAPNDKILLEEHIYQTCSYVNAVTRYQKSFLIGFWP